MSARTFLRWQVGDVRITRVLELEASGLSFLLPEAVPENLRSIEWLRPHFVVRGDEAVAAIQSFVLESWGRRILIDTCAGDEGRRSIPARIEVLEPYLQDLDAAGFAPRTIDTVVHTHLHFDHIGWDACLAEGMRLPTFPGARHLVARTEWEHWSAMDRPEIRSLLAGTLRPVIEAGLLDLIEPDHELAPGIRLEPTPGHTPGHVSVRIHSRGEEAVITGDLIHHPAQMARPAWTSTFDTDPKLARTTRLRFLERHAGTDVLVLGTHFARAPAGRVVREGAAFRFAV
ncbi:MAG: MBL fold metallo-hydrolase [Deinococcus sp.]|nr:MBL fold metallo-hydrolase [Deinococcus sp.]